MIPIIAILFASGEASHSVGIGAILGAPFMLATLAMFVTGITVLAVARRRSTGDTMQVDTQVLAHDMRYFAIAYALAIGAAFLPVEPVWLKWIVAAVLIGIYAWYVKGHFEADPDVDAEDLAPLRFRRLDRTAHRSDPTVPRLRVVNLQVLAALGLIVIGAVFFVDAVDHLASQLGIDEVLLALVIAPIATELPEKFNSIIWVRAGKDTLAMGNITGAMVFQSTIPTVVALVFASSSWVAAPGSYLAFASAGIAFLASGRDLHPDGPVRAAPGAESPDGRCLLPGVSRRGDRGDRGCHGLRVQGPLLYSPARIRPSPAALRRRVPRRSRTAC